MRMTGSRMQARTFLGLTYILFLVVLFGSRLLYAEPAPVYDADAMQQPQPPFNEAASNYRPDLPASPPFNEAASNYNPDASPPLEPAPSPPAQEGAYILSHSPVGSPPPPSRPQSIEQRVRRMEQQIDNIQNNELNARVDSLQGQLQVLRGQIEQLSHLLEQAQNQQKNTLNDLDKRIAQQATTIRRMLTVAGDPGTPAPDQPATQQQATTEAAPKQVAVSKAVAQPAPAASANQNPTQPNVVEEQQIYQSAYNYIKAKQYADAVNTLQGMLKKYPSGQFASNAHYWLGELYVLMAKNDQAINEFNSVVSHFPDSPRVSDALFKVGHIYASQLKWDEAKQTFKKVVNLYPGTASARLASEQLKQIKEAGH